MSDPDSRDGRSLLLRTEYQSQAEYRASAMIAYRRNGAMIPEAKLIYGKLRVPLVIGRFFYVFHG